MPESCLLDSNILLRMMKSDDAHYAVIRKALEVLSLEGATLCFNSQTLAEFWNVSTRPSDQNGFGLSILEADRAARVIEANLVFLPDSLETHTRWRHLLIDIGVKGVQVHDARLAASMYVHGVRQLLTINVRDFRRFSGLRIVHPAELRIPEN